MTNAQNNPDNPMPPASGSMPPAEGAAQPVAHAATSGNTIREDVVAKEKEQFGGMKFGSAFFGWLTATGAAVLLTALVAGIGTAIGLGSEVDPNEAAEAAAENVSTVGLVGAIVLAVIVFVAYFCGGYVAGRMARFNGIMQGIAVWIWAVVIAVVLAIIGAIAGSQFNFLAELNSAPSIPMNADDLTLGSIITAIVIALLSLAGAILGGLTGMRYHRQVDKAGLGR